MKYLSLVAMCLLSYAICAQENLILNPNFEEGDLPDGYHSIDQATHWNVGCYVSASGLIPPANLNDAAIPDGSTLCKFDVPSNKFWSNLYGVIGNRYADFLAYGNDYDGGPNDHRSSLLGTLSAPLDAACEFEFKMNLANAEHHYTASPQPLDLCDDSHVPYPIWPNKSVDIVLRKDQDCDIGLTVLTFTLDSSTDWTEYVGTFTLTPEDAAVGYNRIEIKRGEISDRFVLACDAVSLSLITEELVPSFTGDSQFCQGDDLTFVGSDGPGTAQYTFWEIQETNQYGAPVEGGFNWYTWTPDAPGTFTFPAEVNPPCNRYYWIKMAVNNPCNPWEESVQIIHIGCNPKLPKPQKLTVCERDCIDLAADWPMYVNVSYQWYANGQDAGNQLPLEVCPDESTGYWLVATNTITGCSSTTFFLVDVITNDPSWSHTEHTNVAPNYYHVEAVANNLNTGDIPGFEYSWTIEPLSNIGTPICIVDNADCWQTHPAPTFFQSYSGGCLENCPSPQNGKFYYNRPYRITRETWADGCSVQRQVKILYAENPESPMQTPKVMAYSEAEFAKELQRNTFNVDTRADFNEHSKQNGLLATGIELAPNPNNGNEFFVMLDQFNPNAESLTIRISSIEGKVLHVQTSMLVGNEKRIKVIPTQQLAAGIYLVTIEGNNQKVSRKMIVH